MAERVKPSPERTELMRIARKAGKTYVEIGAAFGLSSSQVERIIGKKSKAQRTYNVSNPVRTPLDPAKCGTTAQARAHYRRGEQPCEKCRAARNKPKEE